MFKGQTVKMIRISQILCVDQQRSAALVSNFGSSFQIGLAYFISGTIVLKPVRWTKRGVAGLLAPRSYLVWKQSPRVSVDAQDLWMTL